MVSAVGAVWSCNLLWLTAQHCFISGCHSLGCELHCLPGSYLFRSEKSELVLHLGTQVKGKRHLRWCGKVPSLGNLPAGPLELRHMSRWSAKLFQDSSDFLRIVVPRASFTLVADPALLYHVEPLRQGRVELAALVLHCVHHHRALGAPGQQQACRLHTLLEAPVLPDVHVVLKSPAICGVSFFNVNDEEIGCGGKVIYESLELVKFEKK